MSRCKKTIYSGGFHGRQCRREGVMDGWCKQHHPQLVANRRKERSAKWQRQWDERERLQKEAAERQAAIPRKARELAENICDMETMDYQDLPRLKQQARELLSLLEEEAK